MATLLIVEDDRKTNEAICEYLKLAGHKLIPAYDGESALQCFSNSRIDLIVLDIMLPKNIGAFCFCMKSEKKVLSRYLC